MDRRSGIRTTDVRTHVFQWFIPGMRVMGHAPVLVALSS